MNTPTRTCGLFRYAFLHDFNGQEYGGWDMAKIVRNSDKITGWGEQHVKSLLYQILCGLLYMQVGV